MHQDFDHCYYCFPLPILKIKEIKNPKHNDKINSGIPTIDPIIMLIVNELLEVYLNILLYKESNIRPGAINIITDTSL